MPPRCTGKVEAKVNPFFKIAKDMMNKLKSKGANGVKESFTDLAGEQNTSYKTKANTDF